MILFIVSPKYSATEIFFSVLEAFNILANLHKSLNVPNLIYEHTAAFVS